MRGKWHLVPPSYKLASASKLSFDYSDMDFGTMCFHVFLHFIFAFETELKNCISPGPENLSIPGGFSHQQPVLVKTNGCHRRETGEAGTRAAPDQIPNTLCTVYQIQCSICTKYTELYAKYNVQQLDSMTASNTSCQLTALNAHAVIH